MFESNYTFSLFLWLESFTNENIIAPIVKGINNIKTASFVGNVLSATANKNGLMMPENLPKTEKNPKN